MERTESLLYRANKARLYAEGHGVCFICGKKEDLQVHHMMCPYAKQREVDYQKLKQTCESFDVYGYSAAMLDVPMTSVDDIRNLIVLCQSHHKRADHGIHNIPFADWLMQKVRASHED